MARGKTNIKRGSPEKVKGKSGGGVLSRFGFLIMMALVAIIAVAIWQWSNLTAWAGDIVTVSDGYARNYLIPQKIAVSADKNNIERIQKKMKKLELAGIKEKDEAAKAAGEIEKLTLFIDVQAGENEKLFGAVTSQQIAEKLAEKGVTVDKKKVLIDDSIKQLGEYTVDIKIHPEITAKLKVIVEKSLD